MNVEKKWQFKQKKWHMPSCNCSTFFADVHEIHGNALRLNSKKVHYIFEFVMFVIYLIVKKDKDGSFTSDNAYELFSFGGASCTATPITAA